MDIEPRVIAAALESFHGVDRRFQVKSHDGITVIDDYAHHPTAIEATLGAARTRFPGRRLIAVYQPHMYSRTKTFFEQFLTAFDKADVVMIADIFPGRERDTGLVHARELVEAMAKSGPYGSTNRQVMYGGDVEGTAKLLRSTLRSGDVAIIMGAGDVYIVTKLLLDEL